MKWFFATLLALIVLLVVALVNIPATIVPYALNEAKVRGLLPPQAPRVTLADVDGTLWQGGANQTEIVLDGVPLNLGRLEWKIDVGALMERVARIDLSTRSEQINLIANVSAVESGVITVRGLEGHLPISVLEPWFPKLVTGDIGFVVDKLVFTQQQLMALDGLLNLEYVDWVGADHNMPLGSYMAQMGVNDNHDLVVNLHDFAARLGIDGKFVLNNLGQYQFNATLTPREGLAPEVAQSITWLGKADRSGNVTINKRGRM